MLVFYKFNKKIIFLFTFLLIINYAYTQLGNNWCFADSVFIKFNTGIAISNNFSNIYQSSGSSISDEDGNLLFYSNGKNIWNKLNQIMLNGSNLGYYPTSYSLGPANAMILPFPNNDSLYYVFYVNSISYWNQLRLFYSIVNINKVNGLGEVIQKDILISNENLTYFTIIKKDNNNYWLVSKHINLNRFHTFNISSNGINFQPIISDFTNNNPILTSFTGYNGDFYVKASPDGSKIVGLTYSVFDTHKPYIYDFNIQTGLLSNPHQLAVPNTQGVSRIAGMSFSPNSKRLYIVRNQSNTNLLAQYTIDDLSTSPFIISDSCLVKQQISSLSTHSYYDLQIGPNNILYISRVGSNYLSSIINPNDTGTQCNYIDTAVVFSKGLNFASLPFFYNTIYAPVLKIQATRQYCNNIAFSFTGPFSGATYKQWSFGDGNFSNDSAVTHTYAISPMPDSVLVTLKVVNVGNTDTLIKRKWVRLFKNPTANINAIQTNGCANSPIIFNGNTVQQDTATIVQTQWQLGNGATQSNTTHFTYSYTNTGNYLVKYWCTDSRGCSDTAYTNMVINKKAKAGFSISNPICNNTIFTLTGQTNVYNTLINKIKYILPNGDSVIKQDNNPFTLLSKDTGSFSIKQNIITNNGCTDTFTVNYQVYETPLVNAGGHKNLVNGNSILLDAFAINNLPNITYHWQPTIELNNNNILQPLCAATTTRVYKITATNLQGCYSTDSLQVKVFAKIIIPNAFSPNGDGVNDAWDLSFATSYPKIKISVYSRAGNLVFYATGKYTTWKGLNMNNHKPLPVGTYYYVIDLGNGEKALTGWVMLLK